MSITTVTRYAGGGIVNNFIDGLPVNKPAKLINMQFDAVYIAAPDHTKQIRQQLLGYGIRETKIITPTAEYFAELKAVILEQRVKFMYSFAEYSMHVGLTGSVTECGVFKGEFAKEINKAFPGRKLFLFDTFEGFSDSDLAVEETVINRLRGEKFSRSKDWRTVFAQTSVSDLIAQMPYPENILIKKGHFPETFDIPDERFVFVSLDVDLYALTRVGIEMSYTRKWCMTKLSKRRILLDWN
jgi:hypothetical protein